MLTIRRGSERGHLNHGWLDTYHTFSFGDYYDPDQMGFRSLRVINEDRVAPGQGFGMHGHRDMEIVTVVLSGSLEHRDSLGNGEVLTPGELQRMTAGRGVRHSEFNPSATESVHLYQIWLLPDQTGLEPEYEQRRFDDSARRDKFLLAASGDGRDGSMRIHQDASIYLAVLTPGVAVEQKLHPPRHAWLQVARGSVELQVSTPGESPTNAKLVAGDAAAISEVSVLKLTAGEPAEVILFDLN